MAEAADAALAELAELHANRAAGEAAAQTPAAAASPVPERTADLGSSWAAEGWAYWQTILAESRAEAEADRAALEPAAKLL